MPTVNGENWDVGCYVDGHHGQYAVEELCEILDGVLGIEDWRTTCGGLRADAENEEGDVSADAWDGLAALYDEATDRLNKLTTGGYWDWQDGELFLCVHEPDEDELDAFIDGYIEAMLWAGCLPTEEESQTDDWESGGRTHLEVSLATRSEIVEKGQLVEFVTENYGDLQEYVERRDAVRPPTGESIWAYAGHDHFLTREHSGVGFWDRGLGELGNRLTEASQAYGSADDHMLWDNGDGTAVC